MTALFWCSVSIVFYAYFGYPLALALLRAVRERPVARSEDEPAVTMVVPVHNQPVDIRKKIENTLSLDYPPEKLRLVVSSDGSTDATNEVVRSFADRGVVLVSSDERSGKVAAQMRALSSIQGRIAIFTDASILLNREALRAIVRPFADPAVGCVSSEDHVPGGGEGLYVRYEMWLRRMEGSIRTLIGVSGSFYAIRTNLIEETPIRYTRDFLVPLTVIEKGYRVLSEPDAQGHFLPAVSAGSEFQRKVRTVMRGMDVLWYRRRLLNPFRFPFVSFALVSHKIFRWAVPIAMTAAFFANLPLLAAGPVYVLTFAAQLGLYALGAAAFFLPRVQNLLPAKAALFFLVTNGAILLAWIRYLSGERAVVWKPTER
ncbi:MAG: glycosyltransferase family 2 protein [Gemmatimonadetes bacterium]|nr:glycosyltransferase family 2 protein [Gemmatimonadota bacterium]